MDIGAQAVKPVQPVPEPPRVAAVAPVAEARPQTDTGSQRNPEDGSDGRRPISVNDVVQRNLTIDPETRTVVYQALNARGEVVLQLPDRAILRMRAYVREMQLAEAEPETGGRVERVA